MTDSNGSHGRWWAADGGEGDISANEVVGQQPLVAAPVRAAAPPTVAGPAPTDLPASQRSAQAQAPRATATVVIPHQPEIVMPHHPTIVSDSNRHTEPNKHVNSTSLQTLPAAHGGVPTPVLAPVAQGRPGEAKPLQFSASAWHYFGVALVCSMVAWIPFFGWAAFVVLFNGFIASSLRVGGRRVRFTMGYGAALWLVTRNFLVTFLTFGLGLYWVAVTSWRQLYDSVEYVE